MAKLHSRIYGWKHVWMEFSDEYQGTVDDPNPDSSHEQMSVIVPIQDTDWNLVYTMHPKTKTRGDYTTVDVSYVSSGEFKVALHPEKFHHGFGKLLGMQDIIVGHEDFDKAFIIKGTDDKKVAELFEDAALRRLLMEESSIQLWTQVDNTDSQPSRRALRPDYNTLSLRLQGAVDDFERLKLIYKLMHRLLSAMCRIGVAEQD